MILLFYLIIFIFVNNSKCEEEGLEYVLNNINPVKNLFKIFNNNQKYDDK